MKHLKIVLFALILLTVLGMNGLSVKIQAQSLKEASLNYAALIASKEAIKRLKGKDIKGINNECKNIILANIEIHRHRKNSEDLIELFLEKRRNFCRGIKPLDSVTVELSSWVTPRRSPLL